MIKISKLTDYGMVLLSHMAKPSQKEFWTAKELSAATHIPQPTVGKLLKLLSKGEILSSTRGSQGGYKLAREAGSVSLATVIRVLEGEGGITECSESGSHVCRVQTFCVNRSNWQRINHAVVRALENLSLSDMASPIPFNSPKLRIGGEHG